MDNRVETVFLENPLKSFGAANIGFVKFEIGIILMPRDVGALDRGRIKFVEIIQNANLPRVFRQQFIYQMRADKSRAACY
jgi:hypothetical protein